MHEHEPIMIEDDLWSHDLVLGEALVDDDLALIRCTLQVADEPYREHHTPFPLTHAEGVRTSILAAPYILETATTRSVDASPSLTTSGVLNEDVDATRTGLQPRWLGTAQAWAYSTDRLLVLGACLLDDGVRQESPLTDPVLTTVWTGFERVLVNWFPQVERITTPSWEDHYERPAWQQFLAGQDYTPFTPGWFAKRVRSGMEMTGETR
jgi:hypothetical protein